MAALGMMHVPLPGIVIEDFEHVIGGPFVITNLSIAALGVMPLLVAGFLVELFTLWRPAPVTGTPARSFGFWRGDRGGSPGDFASRHRLVYRVTLLLAVVQAVGIAKMLRGLNLPSYPDSDYLLIATLIGGVFCHAALARVIDEEGLGNGVLVLFLCNAFGDLPQAALLGQRVWPNLLAVCVAGLLAWVLIRSKRGGSPRVPLLPAGLVPAGLASYTVLALEPLGATSTLSTLVEGAFTKVGVSSPGTRGFELHAVLSSLGANAIAILVSGGLVSFMLVRPVALARLWARVTETGDSDSWVRILQPALWLGVALTVGFSLAISLLDRGASYLKSNGMLASAGALAAAVVLDIIDELRASPDATVVWVDTRVAWVAPIQDALRRAGISSITLGGAGSSLLPLNGPLVATKILVAPSDSARSLRVITEVLAERSGVVPAASGPAPVETPTVPRRAFAATLAGVLIGGAMVAWPVSQAIREDLAPPPPGEAATLAFLLVDDDSDPLGERGTAGLEHGIEIERENVPLGEGRGVALRTYAVVLRRSGESQADAGERLLAFLKTVAIPPRRRWALEALPAEEGDGRGWRSFLLNTETPGPTEGDLRSVEVFPNGPEELEWMLHLEFTPQGGRLFEELTRANVKRRFAILVNDEIESAPVINGPITGGSAVITMGRGGSDNRAVATQLRDALKRSIRKR